MCSPCLNSQGEHAAASSCSQHLGELCFCLVLLGFLCRRGGSSYLTTLLLFASHFLTFQAGSPSKLVTGILTMGCPSVCVKLREAEGWVV